MVVASALHAEGPGFETQHLHLILFFHFYPRIQHYPLPGNLYSKHISMYKMCIHVHVHVHMNMKESNISCNY